MPSESQTTRSSRVKSRRKKLLTDKFTLQRVGRSLLRLFRASCWIAGAIGIVCGLYLCLRPSSVIGDIPWLPRTLVRWADYYGRFRNLPAFALLAVPFMFVANGRRARAKAIAWLAVFSAAVEGAQYFIPTRWCEWQDVAWSWAGLAVTWVLTEIGFKVAWQIRCFFRDREKAAAKASRAKGTPRRFRPSLPIITQKGKS